VRLRVRTLLPMLFVAAVATAGAGEAYVNTPSDGGNGGWGGGGSYPTAPPGNMCYLASGLGTSMGLDSLGDGFMRATLNWTLGPGNSYTSQLRTVAVGADGEVTYDSGWVDMTSDGTTLPGGQSGSASQTLPDGTDYSGGLTIVDRFTNMEGQTSDADGMIYPPDPVTDSC
jgi:hypothetical protein